MRQHIKFTKTDDGYYKIIRDDSVIGYIAPSPFGKGWLVGYHNSQGGVAFRTLARAKQYAKIVS